MAGIQQLLKEKLSSLHRKYWQQLFTYYQPIKNKLTSYSVGKLVNHVLESKMSFTVENCQAVTIFAINQANLLIDEQVLDLYKIWASRGNAKAYKSNAKLFQKQNFRYLKDIDINSPFALEYRIVDPSANYGRFFGNAKDGTSLNDYSNEGVLKQLKDMIIIFGNFGYQIDNLAETNPIAYGERQSLSGSKNGKKIVILDYKFFKNGNAHYFINKQIMIDIMVLVGKKLGWLHNKEQACEELNISSDEYDTAMQNTLNNPNLYLGAGSMPLLGYN